eukprot:g45757.t1
MSVASPAPLIVAAGHGDRKKSGRNDGDFLCTVFFFPLLLNIKVFQSPNISKLLGRLCEQSKNQRDQEKWVLQLRKEKESLESALEKTHREMEMYPNQPGYTEQLVQKKESLQNQLINIRGELSQATTAFANTKMECDALKMELSIIHNDLWEQLNSPMGMQDEVGHKHIQKELWKIQDVMEGLRKSYPDRITTEPLKQH